MAGDFIKDRSTCERALEVGEYFKWKNVSERKRGEYIYIFVCVCASSIYEFLWAGDIFMDREIKVKHERESQK